jgi:hypothetical protein
MLTSSYGPDGRPVLIKEPKLVLNDHNAGKAEGTHLMIGRRPHFAIGNPTGDRLHYVPDVWRAWSVRNSWVVKPGEEVDSGFFDSSVFEASKRRGDDVLKAFLRDGMENTSVTHAAFGSRSPIRGGRAVAIRTDLSSADSRRPRRKAARWCRSRQTHQRVVGARASA